VRSITLDDVRAYYKQQLSPANLVIGFAGDVTEEHARALAGGFVERLATAPAPPDDIPEPALQPGRRLVFVDKPERTQTQILIGRLGTWPHDADHTALTVASAIFGGTFTSRLMKEIRSKRGWSYGASARAAIDRRRQAFSMWTFPSAADAPKCIALEIDMLQKLSDKGVTPAEVRFIQRYLARSFAFEVDTAPKRLHHALDTELLNLPEGYFSTYVERIGEVTAEAASTAVRARLAPDALLVAVVGTASQLLDDVTRAVPGIESTSVVPFDVED
jgi:zinc protease